MKLVALLCPIPASCLESRGASSLGWAIMARHRPNLATRDDTLLNIDISITSIVPRHPVFTPPDGQCLPISKVFVGVISKFPFPRWTIFLVHALHLVGFDVEVHALHLVGFDVGVHALHLVGFDVEVFLPLERLPATANESVLLVLSFCYRPW